MRQLDKQQWILITTVLLCVTGIGGLRVAPLLHQRRTLDETIQQHRQTLEEIHADGARLPDLAQQLDHMRAQAAVFDARIPAGRGFGDLWQQIADLMNQYHLSEQHVQPGPAVQADQLGAIPLTLAAVGTMQDLFAFFQAIEQWQRLIRFEQVELVNDSRSDGSVKLNAKAVLYYQIEPKQG